MFRVSMPNPVGAPCSMGGILPSAGMTARCEGSRAGEGCRQEVAVRAACGARSDHRPTARGVYTHGSDRQDNAERPHDRAARVIANGLEEAVRGRRSERQAVSGEGSDHYPMSRPAHPPTSATLIR